MNETVAFVVLAVGFVVYVGLLARDIYNYNKMMNEWKDDE